MQELVMQELTASELEQVNGGGRAGAVIGNAAPLPLGGGVRVGSDGANN